MAGVSLVLVFAMAAAAIWTIRGLLLLDKQPPPEEPRATSGPWQTALIGFAVVVASALLVWFFVVVLPPHIAHLIGIASSLFVGFRLRREAARRASQGVQ
ncbi:MAG TPA: hypothetical protein VM784_07455 [Actinomycetota bacterium]|jgi:amino acid transporter|nr:hypothetical protein [Actinomycetota bacterium]